MYIAVLWTMVSLGVASFLGAWGFAACVVGLLLAWAYVVLRVVHSLVQVLVNKIEVRFLVFMLSSLIVMLPDRIKFTIVRNETRLRSFPVGMAISAMKLLPLFVMVDVS